MPAPELVVLLDDLGNEIGEREKASVHGTETPLHLAFSCYLLNDQGQLLVTRRALSKQAWPGVWTNSFCGHPSPGEDPADAVHRRADQELGARVRSVRLVLPDFRYRAVDAHGVVENEICPVYLAQLDGGLAPHAAEVADWRWMSSNELSASLASTPLRFSPWLQGQWPQLLEQGAFAAAVLS